MKYSITIFFIIIYFFTINLDIKTYSTNIDSSKLIFNQHIELLEKMIKTIHKYTEKDLCMITNDSLIRGFSVVDIVDTSNFQIAGQKSYINFIDKHIYHYSSYLFKEFYSHIGYYENDKLTIFEAINCKDKGDSFQKMYDFIQEKIAKNPNKNSILKRVKNYRKYGKYFAIDNYVKLDCDCEPCY